MIKIKKFNDEVFFEIGNETTILIFTPGLHVLEILSTKEKKNTQYLEKLWEFKKLSKIAGHRLLHKNQMHVYIPNIVRKLKFKK